MGVKGLWKLLLPIGRRISIETLSGKTLAIDASIWLTQFVKAMRDPETGKVVNAAHLIGFFRRICRLRYHGIKPVFVFDGATPEIKRNEVLRRKRKREVFASNLNDMTVQRLAKKLLSENLRKARSKKEEETKEEVTPDHQGEGAYATGFHPGAQTQTNEAEADLEDLIKNGPENSLQVESSTGVSDWDLPLEVAAAEEAKEMDQEEDENSAHSDPYGDDGFRSHAVAMLPPHKRKDAIEKAKRAQRMQSRREFMPAAAKPQDFSSVQVRNFLKYCKLNQDIVSMAKQAASREDGGFEGNTMASDRTTRIELIREDEDSHANTSDHGYTATNGGPRSLLKEKLDSQKRRTGNLSSDESWNGGEEHSSVAKERAILYDSDDTNQDSKPQGSRKRSMIHIEDSSDDESVVKNVAHSQLEDDPQLLDQKNHQFDEPVRGPSNDDSKSPGKRNAAELQLPSNKSESRLREALGDTESCDSMDDVDWEDGDASPNFRGALGDTEICDSMDDVDWEDGDASHDALEVQKHGLHAAKPACGFASLPTETLTCSSSKDEPHGVMELGTNFTGGEKKNNDVDVEDRTTESFRSSPSDGWVVGADEGDNSPHPRTDEIETSAALQQAQETATHLTNWAGRAFRRAMKEVGEAPQTKPNESPLPRNTGRSPKVHADCDGAPDVQGVVAGSAKSPREALPDNDRKKRMKPPPERSTQSTVEGGETTVAGIIDWETVRNRHERDADGISDEMLIEAKELLQLSGIPYVEAPAEAEACCVALEELGLVHGIVSDDSDVFVFGGKIVYKNIFEEQKFTEVYKAADAEREMDLGHNAMVALAMLLGSDYTEGVKGVGIVNAMEILKAFEVNENLKGGLQRFKKWMEIFDHIDTPESQQLAGLTTLELSFHAQHRTARTRWELPGNFPSDAVIKAYLDPVVDRSSERFSWGAPDVANLIGFCEAHMDWPEDKTREHLQPVVEALKQGARQTRIDSFMKYEDSIKFGEIKSKRLRKALGLPETVDDQLK